MLLMTIMGLWAIGCQKKDAPLPTIPPFTVTVKQRTGVADLKPSRFVNDLALTWNKAKAPNGDLVTYAVVYKDTLTKNLADTTFTIPNVGDNILVTGSIVAKTKQGLTTAMPFNFTSGMAPRLRIKKWISQSDTYKYYNFITYTYDNMGRLASFNSQQGKVCCFTTGQTTVLKYNQLGQLISVEGLPNGDTTGQFFAYLDTYEYDSKGNPVLIKNYTSPIYQQTPLVYRSDDKHDYDATGLLIKSTISNPSSQAVYDYVYSNGNMISIKDNDRSTTNTYQYDDKPNPFYGLLSSSLRTPATSIYSKNNVISTGATYTYDSAGIIVKAVSSDPKLRIDMYEYEQY